MRLCVIWAVWVTAVCLAACGGGGGSSGSSAAVGAPSSADGKSAVPGSENAASTTVVTKVGEAKSGEESALRPLALSPFSRANTYELYAANGSQKLLRLDYSTARYEILDTLGHSTSGTFSEDANEPGTYIFASERIASTNSTARFRVTPGAVVGAFPFERYGAAGYATVPFVAANDFVTEAAQLDGDYNRLGISLTSSGTLDSQILSMRLSGGGAQLEMCWTNIIYRISQCPAESKRTYALTASTESRWIGTDVSNPSDVIQFRMARINGQNVYLFAGWSDAAPDTHVLRIGLKDSPDWPTARYVGGATDQTWGANVISDINSSRSSIGPDATTGTLDLPVTALAAGNPVGIRSINGSGTQKYFATKNSALSVVVGTRNPNTQGYIQVNLLDPQFVAPSHGVTYKVFATNGTMQTLTVDLANLTYSMTDAVGAPVSGNIAKQSGTTNTYTFLGQPGMAYLAVKSDVIVGAFPFWNSSTSTRTLAPFIAVPSLITDAVQLDGLYNDIQIVRYDVPQYPFNDSLITSFRIEGAGARMIYCASYVVTSFDACTSKVTLNLQRGASDDEWIGLTGAPYDGPGYNDPTMIAMQRTLRFARIGGQVMAIHSAKTPTIAPYVPGNVFRIATQEPDFWTNTISRGPTTSGDWGVFTTNASTYSPQWTAPVASPRFQIPVNLITVPGRTGLRAAEAMTQYFVVESAPLTVLVSSHTNYADQGFLHLGLND